MNYQEAFVLTQSILLLNKFFNDPKKVSAWLITPNPFIGDEDAVPMTLFLTGRGHKVLHFIETAASENTRIE